jgi:hypothetical protein
VIAIAANKSDMFELEETDEIKAKQTAKVRWVSYIGSRCDF